MEGVIPTELSCCCKALLHFEGANDGPSTWSVRSLLAETVLSHFCRALVHDRNSKMLTARSFMIVACPVAEALAGWQASVRWQSQSCLF